MWSSSFFPNDLAVLQLESYPEHITSERIYQNPTRERGIGIFRQFQAVFGEKTCPLLTRRVLIRALDN
jgi:hypothetical protein